MHVLLYFMLETYTPIGFWFNHPKFASLDQFGIFESVFEVNSHSKNHTYYLGAFLLDEGEVCLYAPILTWICIHWNSLLHLRPLQVGDGAEVEVVDCCLVEPKNLWQCLKS